MIDIRLGKHGLLRKALSFGLVGVFNAGVDFCIFSVAYLVLALPIIGANLLAWLVAVTSSYVLNTKFTFAAESGRRLSVRSYFMFAVAQLAGFLANTATVFACSYFMPVLVGKVLAIGASFLVNFSLSNFVVFRKRS
ncbi:MAG: GtrA family protein [Pseudolabrys sp.]|nr:GtrA family protein [Pseudolabrys sp.]MBV9956353.1 GtrA family protein [Pseudolabrys sp.]